MTLQYLIQIIKEMNPVMDRKETFGDISDIPYDHINDIPYDYSKDQYRATLTSEVDKRCYDDEVNLTMGAA